MAVGEESKNDISSDRVIFCILTAVAIILIPATSGISILFYFVLISCGVCIIESEKSKAKEDALHQSVVEKDDSMVDDKNFDMEAEDSEDILLDRYIFPSKCPHCLAELDLDEIEWVETNSGLCPKCESLIKAERI